MTRSLFAGALAAPLLALSAHSTRTSAQVPNASAPPTPVTITVETAPRQTFKGFGTSVFPWVSSEKYRRDVTPAQNEQMARMVFTDLKMRHIRMWMHPGQDVGFYVDGWIKTGRLPAAMKAGARDLLLAPEEIPSAMGDGKGYIRDDQIPVYAGILADFISDFRARTGVLISYAGILNEPNDRPVKFTDAQWPQVIKALRQALDARGLKAVKIVAPEMANVDAVMYRVTDAIKADAAAWNALPVLATHSYAMAATEEMARRTLAARKDYWMTEASDNGPEVPGDALRAAGLASRVLNDLNHGVTHWTHFIGWEEADPKDNATRILSYEIQPFKLNVFQKYYYYRSLARTFDVGARLRHSTSDLDGEMTYTYGKKPRINAAVARNLDGSWGIGVSNFTSPTFSDRDDPGDHALHNSGYAARTFAVTLKVPEMGKKVVRFKVRRSNRNVNDVDAGEAVMQNGTLTLPNVAPLDLITLRSVR